MSPTRPSSAPGCCIRTGVASSSLETCANLRDAESGSTHATLQAEGMGARPALRAPPSLHWRVHVRHARGYRPPLAARTSATRWPTRKVDWCLRTWQAGFSVLYFPADKPYHHESVTRGTGPPGEPRCCLHDCSGIRWGELLRVVTCATPKGKMRVAYVTEGRVGIGAGTATSSEHFQSAARRGHEVACTRSARRPTGLSYC